MSLTLQFNLKGSWRNTLTFDADIPSLDFDLVVDAALVLLQLASPDASLRIVDEGGEVAVLVDKFGRRDWPYRKSAA